MTRFSSETISKIYGNDGYTSNASSDCVPSSQCVLIDQNGTEQPPRVCGSHLTDELDFLESFVSADEFEEDTKSLVEEAQVICARLETKAALMEQNAIFASYSDEKRKETNAGTSIVSNEEREDDASSFRDLLMIEEWEARFYEETHDLVAGDAVDLVDLENDFCRDYLCCGVVLKDMHDLLQHYEEHHVQIVEDCDMPVSTVPPIVPMTPLTSFSGVKSGAALEADPIPGSSTLNLPSNTLLAMATSSYDDLSMKDTFVASMLADFEACCEVEGPVAAFDTSIITKSVKRSANKCDHLIRRIGDVEDDLTVRLLELMSEELAMGGKRVKLMVDVVEQVDGPYLLSHPQSRLSSSNSLPSSRLSSCSTSNEYSRLQQQHRNRSNHQKNLQSSRTSTDLSEDEIDVVTVDNFDSSESSLIGPEKAVSGEMNLDVPQHPLPHFNQQNEMHASKLSLMSPCSASAHTSTVQFNPEFLDTQRQEKPYRCIIPGCDKAYKNPNGLKYHNLHGHCEGEDECCGLVGENGARAFI